MTLPFDRALVTGGAGFIGSHLVEALISQGIAVTVLDDLSAGKRENLGPLEKQVHFIEGDIRNRELVKEATRGADVVFHLAALVSVPRSIERPVQSAMINDLGTLHVLEAARTEEAQRVILSSSCAVYGDDPRLPKDEGMAPKPVSPYAHQKLTGEGYARLYCDLYGLETVCLRYFNVFGPRQDPSSPYSGVISLFMTQAVKGRQPSIHGDGSQYRDFVYVKDVAAANLSASKAAGVGGDTFNVGTGGFVRILDLWEQIRQLAGSEMAPRFLAPRLGDIRESVADVGRTRSSLGFSPAFSFSEGLSATFEWYKRHS